MLDQYNHSPISPSFILRHTPFVTFSPHSVHFVQSALSKDISGTCRETRISLLLAVQTCPIPGFKLSQLSSLRFNARKNGLSQPNNVKQTTILLSPCPIGLLHTQPDQYPWFFLPEISCCSPQEIRRQKRAVTQPGSEHSLHLQPSEQLSQQLNSAPGLRFGRFPGQIWKTGGYLDNIWMIPGWYLDDSRVKCERLEDTCVVIRGVCLKLDHFQFALVVYPIVVLASKK